MRHDTFTISRQLDVPRAAVFAAFADTDIRRRWCRLPGADASYDHDFRVSGGESARSRFTGLDAAPEQLEYRSRYIDIAADHRLVYDYQMVVDEVLRWTALVTVELHTASPGTRLVWTEQAAFVTYSGDGDVDVAHLRGGTRLRLNGLDAVLRPSTDRRSQHFPRLFLPTITVAS